MSFQSKPDCGKDSLVIRKGSIPGDLIFRFVSESDRRATTAQLERDDVEKLSAYLLWFLGEGSEGTSSS